MAMVRVAYQHSATDLSCVKGVRKRFRSRFIPLARRSLLPIAMLLLPTACLLPDPPDYRREQKTAPSLTGIVPSPTEVLLVNSGDLIDFSVKVRSEDLNDQIVGQLFLNYLVEDRQEGAGWEQLLPGSYADARDLTITWKVPLRTTPGTCEQLSMVVTHGLNLYPRSHLPIDENDVAVVTWWLSINDSEQTLGQCPRAGKAP